MNFWITIKVGFKNYRLFVEHTIISERSEHFKVIGRNKFIVLESNRPLFRNKGLKHRKPYFKIIEGQIDFYASIQVIIDAILLKVDH
jgi:hypothetical protein